MKRFLFLLFAAALALSLAACGPEARDRGDTPEGAKITGTVLDETSGTALKGVSVTYVSARYASVKSCMLI